MPSRSTTSTCGCDDDERGAHGRVQRGDLAARPPRRGGARRPRGGALRRRGRRRTARCCARRGGCSRRSPSSGSARGARRRDDERLARDDRLVPRVACGRASIPVPLSTMLRPERLAAIVADAGAAALVVSTDVPRPRRRGARPRRRPASRRRTSTSPTVADDSGRLPRAGRRSRTTTRRRWPPTTADDSPAFWLYSLGHHRRAEGRDARPRQHAGDLRHVRPRRSSRSRPTTGSCRSPSSSSPTGSATRSRSRSAPAPRRSSNPRGRRRPASPTSSRPRRRRCSSPAPGSSPRSSTPTSNRRRSRSVRATVTAGESLPADLQRRFSERFGHPGARRHRLDRGAAHLHLQHARRAGAGLERAGRAGLRGRAARRRRRTRSTEPDTPGYLHVRGPSTAAGYWQRPEATAAAFRPDGWLRTGDVYARSADDTGRSSGATTT